MQQMVFALLTTALAHGSLDFYCFNPLKQIHQIITLWHAGLTYFWHSGTLALSLSARVPECQKLQIRPVRLGIYGAEHSKCDRMMTIRDLKGYCNDSRHCNNSIIQFVMH